MIGLKKNCNRWRRHTHTHTQTNMATLWPTRPRGAKLVKIWLILGNRRVKEQCCFIKYAVCLYFKFWLFYHNVGLAIIYSLFDAKFYKSQTFFLHLLYLCTLLYCSVLQYFISGVFPLHYTAVIEVMHNIIKMVGGIKVGGIMGEWVLVLFNRLALWERKN